MNSRWDRTGARYRRSVSRAVLSAHGRPAGQPPAGLPCWPNPPATAVTAASPGRVYPMEGICSLASCHRPAVGRPPGQRSMLVLPSWSGYEPSPGRAGSSPACEHYDRLACALHSRDRPHAVVLAFSPGLGGGAPARGAGRRSRDRSARDCAAAPRRSAGAAARAPCAAGPAARRGLYLRDKSVPRPAPAGKPGWRTALALGAQASRNSLTVPAARAAGAGSPGQAGRAATNRMRAVPVAAGCGRASKPAAASKLSHAAQLNAPSRCDSRTTSVRPSAARSTNS